MHRWHDTTPAGRLLNRYVDASVQSYVLMMARFSKDMETVDSSLSGSMRAVTGRFV